MTNLELVAKAKEILSNYKTVYFWGGVGQPITSSSIISKASQYSDWYTSEKLTNIYYPLVGKGYWGFDCIGLVKSIVWGWCGDTSSTMGGAVYGSNGCPDQSANGMISLCSNVSTVFENLVVGEGLWTDGHFGIYIGDGYSIESTPELGGYTPGVKLSAISNMGTATSGTSGSRTWKKHGFLPFITYVDSAGEPIDVGSLQNSNYVDSESVGTNSSLSTGASSTASSGYSFEYSEYESIANLGTQPFHAFIDLWIGNEHISRIPPNYMLSCDITQYSGSADSATNNTIEGNISLLDQYCDKVEYLLITNGGRCKLRAGDVQGRQTILYDILVSEYNISFTSSGSLLTLKFTDGSVADSSTLLTISAGSSPSIAVKAIANKLGWTIGRVDDAKQLKGAGGETLTFSLINEKPIDYIRNTIAPRAIRSSDGKGGYQFYLDSSTTPPTVNFHPVDLQSGGLRTYVYMKGKNSPVIDFSLNSTLTPAQGVVASSYKASGIDPLTKEEFAIDEGFPSRVLDSSTNKTTVSSNLNPQVMSTSGLSSDEIATKVAYRFSSAYTDGLEGTITIIGDPTIAMTDNIRLIILNEDNTMHHISGIYIVLGINHHISGGTMITTLNITRTSSISDAGVVLTSATIKR